MKNKPHEDPNCPCQPCRDWAYPVLEIAMPPDFDIEKFKEEWKKQVEKFGIGVPVITLTDICGAAKMVEALGLEPSREYLIRWYGLTNIPDKLIIWDNVFTEVV